jgi:hypothetical protein
MDTQGREDKNESEFYVPYLCEVDILDPLTLENMYGQGPAMCCL